MESETRVLDPSGKLVNPIDALRRHAGVDAVGVDTSDGEMVFLRGDEELFRADALLLATRDGDELVPCVAEETYGVELAVTELPRELRAPAEWSKGLIAMLQHAFRLGWAHDTLIVQTGLEHLVVHGPLRMVTRRVRKRVPAITRSAYVLDTTFTLLRALFVLGGDRLRPDAFARVARSVRGLRELAPDEELPPLDALADKLDHWATRAGEGAESDVELVALGLEEALRWKGRLASHDARRAELGGASDPEGRVAPIPSEPPRADVDEPRTSLARGADRSITLILVLLALVVALGVAAWIWLGSLPVSR